MKIRYLGHACFLLEDQDGVIMMDPYNATIGKLPAVRADVVLISHGHGDHNYVKGVGGTPEVIDWPGAWSAAGANGEGIATYHDAMQGAKRGENIVQVIEIGGQKIVHCGDLGHMPGEDALAKMRGCDVLLVPVGGFFTIDAQEATALCEAVQPRVTVPMHYKTGGLLPISTVEPFLDGKQNIARLDGDSFDPADATGIIVLKRAK